MKIGFVGGGNMAEAMIKGMTSHGLRDITVSEPGEGRRQYLQSEYSVQVTASNLTLVASCDVIILAVKPQNMEEVTGEIAGHVGNDKVVISIAAGITLDYLSSRLNTKRVIRVMPNTPALVQEGMSVISRGEGISAEDLSTAKEIFQSIGDVLTLPERHMDAVTAVSGSGPAFISFFIEALSEGGTRLGLSPEDARMLAVQTLAGTAKLLSTGMNPSRLREMVTSPGGTTAAGLGVFSEKRLMDTVIDALQAAAARSQELGKTG